jgi:hypothetical protein
MSLFVLTSFLEDRRARRIARDAEKRAAASGTKN